MSCNSNIKNHWSQINRTNRLMMRQFKNCENYQHVTWRYEVNKFCWKTCADRLGWCRVTTNLQLVKKKVNKNTTNCKTIKWSMIKWDLSVYKQNRRFNKERTMCDRYYAIEGEQTISPQNTLLWHINTLN